MTGILTPQKAYNLVKEIKKVISILLLIHTYATSGVSEITYLKAIESDANSIGTANSSLAGETVQASTEVMVIALEALGYETGVELEKFQIVSNHFKQVRERFSKERLFDYKVLKTDPMTLIYQVPKVRKDLGYPPLVTPLSQMVGTQAVMNVQQVSVIKWFQKKLRNTY